MSSDLTMLLGMRLDDVAKAKAIQSLIAGSQTVVIDNRFHLQMPLHGIEIVADFDGRVSTIFLYSGGASGYSQFRGVLPEGIGFADSQSSVYERLGKPSDNGGGQAIRFFGKAPKWDRYDHEGYCLHIQYADNETSISLVSIMRPDSVPR
jgi:hypothetical protein